ncbi:MAG TPA: acetyltransferase [Bacteroidales bacterium]|nr:acetyltransferase [Bacteroidales bacterium]
MRDVIIIGAGGHAAEIDEYITYNQKVSGIRELNIVGFIDDDSTSFERYKFSAPLIGGASDHKVIRGHGYIIGIAGLKYRKSFVDRFKADGAQFVSVIHHSAYVSKSAFIGEGSIIGPNANIGPNVQVGKYTLLNARCSIGHDTKVGDYNFISPNVCFSGFTEVGDENLFGINSATIPAIRIGNRNKIMAGMIIDTNIGDDSVVFYRFKERVIAVSKNA